ncbi:MAG: glycosyltransferase [Planctomycetia bacterium]|nr:glycosyltransferase [Planctomycetia bacterium]
MQPLVSIIIPHWNGIDLITECLESLQKTSYPNVEIIVVDNNSSDDSVNHIRKNFTEVIILENKQNEGYAGGCNRGSEFAKGEFLLFLNNDTVHQPNWIEPLVQLLDENTQIAAAQPKLLNYYRKDLFDYAGGAGGMMDILVFPFARGRIFNKQEIDSNQYNSRKEIFWSSGTAFLVRKTAFEKAGKFDELFFAHMEEIDLCWRFHLLGLDIWSEPSSVVYHKNAVSLPMYTEKKYYLNHRNSLIMLLANYSLPIAIYIFPIRWALDIVAIIYAILNGDWKHIKGIAKAHAWIVSHPRKIYRKRIQVKAVRKVKDKTILRKMYYGSIVFAHYILRKNHYSELTDKPRS